MKTRCASQKQEYNGRALQHLVELYERLNSLHDFSNHEGEQDTKSVHRQLAHIHVIWERLCRLGAANTLFRGDRKRNPSLQQILTLQRLFEARNGEFTPEVGGGPIAMTPCLLDHKVIPSR